MDSPPMPAYGADRELDPDDLAALALLDLRAALVAIAKVDPSNVGGPAAGQTEQYARRNVLVLQALAYAMAAGVPCGVALVPDEGWPLVFIELPTGAQLSWHVPAYRGAYNGHTTAEKYAAIREFSAAFTRPVEGGN